LFDMSKLSGAESYKLLAATIVPRPIAWVTSVNESGAINAAPFSFFNVLAGDPPVVGIGISSRPDGARKDTGLNIQATGEFVVNLVSEETAEAMNVTAIDFPRGVDEVGEAGLSILPSEQIRPPRIAESPVALECRLLRTIDLGVERMIVLGQVVAMHVRDDAVIDAARCYIDTPKLKLIGRMHGAGGYVRMTDRFEMKRIALDQWTGRGHQPPQSG
jgi:flavin reductase (DIM6/NTAB) family NADH-FMN oxidoreductase RutF